MARKPPQLTLKMPEPIKEPVEKPAVLNGSIRIDLGDDKTIDVDPSKITVSINVHFKCHIANFVFLYQFFHIKTSIQVIEELGKLISFAI